MRELNRRTHGKKTSGCKYQKGVKVSREINTIDEEVQKDKQQVETRISQMDVRKLADERV